VAPKNAASFAAREALLERTFRHRKYFEGSGLDEQMASLSLAELHSVGRPAGKRSADGLGTADLYLGSLAKSKGAAVPESRRSEMVVER